MPNPIDALRKASSIGPDPRAVDPSQISRGEMAIGPGSLSGAIAGLRGLFARPAPIRQVAAQIEPLTAGATQRMEQMYQQANPTFRRLQDAGMFGGDRTVGSWSQAAPRAPRAVPRASETSSRMTPVQETLGEMRPDFTPVGGEDMYNVGKRAVQGLSDPVLQAYHKILGSMGR